MLRPLPLSNQPPDHWATNYSGDGTIPPHAERVEYRVGWGLVLFHETRAYPLVVLETEQEICHTLGCGVSSSLRMNARP